MTGSFGKGSIAGIILVILLIVASVPFQRKIDNIRGRFRSIKETLYFSSSALRRISLGYDDLLADIYWLRALQYFGGTRFDETDPALLYKYFDILTDLDPKFVNAYRYGGTFLAEPPPFGLGDVTNGMKLFNKGRMNNPDNFRIPLEQGFFYYLNLKDYIKAYELFKEASDKPGLSDLRRAYLKGMAASAIKKGGNRDLSRQIWEYIYEETPDEGRKNFALLNIKELETMDMEDALTGALREYLNQYKKFPSSLEELKSTGILEEIPKEPLGGDFIIVKKLKEVKSSTFINQKLRVNPAYLSSRAKKFRKFFGRFPEDLDELKKFIEERTSGEFPPHPLGDEYSYNPETGIVRAK
jgi:tetratricopeptide (TPR) repeat protein